MNYTELRRASLKIFLGFLGLTAIIAILCVLAGDFGELSFKVLITTFTISAASISSMSCAAFIEKRRRTQLGLAGIFLSVAAAILLISGLWLESNSDVYWKTTTTFTVLAVALAQAFLLALPELDLRQTWIQPVTSVSIGILALQIIVAVWGEIDAETYYRFLAVMAILVGLETLAVPILMKLRKKNGEKREPLVLERIQDDLYRDRTGKKYQLKELETEPKQGP